LQKWGIAFSKHQAEFSVNGFIAEALEKEKLEDNSGPVEMPHADGSREFPDSR
jgi:hypothetical protein